MSYLLLTDELKEQLINDVVNAAGTENENVEVEKIYNLITGTSQRYTLLFNKNMFEKYGFAIEFDPCNEEELRYFLNKMQKVQQAISKKEMKMNVDDKKKAKKVVKPQKRVINLKQIKMKNVKQKAVKGTDTVASKVFGGTHFVLQSAADLVLGLEGVVRSKTSDLTAQEIMAHRVKRTEDLQLRSIKTVVQTREKVKAETKRCMEKYETFFKTKRTTKLVRLEPEAI